MKVWEAMEKEVQVRKDIQIIETTQQLLRKVSGYSGDTDLIYNELEKLRIKRHNEFNKLVDEIENAIDTNTVIQQGEL